MGFITNRALAQGRHPAFLVEANRVVVREEPIEDATRMGVLKLGDIAVVEKDLLGNWPWVLIPAGSRVRDATDTDLIVDLWEDAYLRVERNMDEDRDAATRCPEGSAAVHLCICRCQHWRVVFDQVLIREEPCDSAKTMGKVLRGDLLCPGATVGSSSGSNSELVRDKRWAYFGPDSAVWTSAAGLNNPPKPLLKKGLMEAAIMKEHPVFGKLISLVKQRNLRDREPMLPACPNGHTMLKSLPDKGFPCDICGQESTPGSVMWGCHKTGGINSNYCSYDICDGCRLLAVGGAGDESRFKDNSCTSTPPVTGLSEHKGSPVKQEEKEETFWCSSWLHLQVKRHMTALDPGVRREMTMTTVRRLLQQSSQNDDRLDRDPDSSKAWLVLTDTGLGVRDQHDPESVQLLELQADDALVCTQLNSQAMLTHGTHDHGMWLVLRTGDRIIREGDVIATVTRKSVYVQVCPEDGCEHIRPWDVLEPRVAIQTISGFGAPWAVTYKQVPVRNEPSTTALPLGLACKNDIIGVHTERDEWVQLVSGTDSRQREGAHARPTHDIQSHVSTGASDKSNFWMLTQHKTLGKLLRRLGGENFSLSTEGLLLSCGRRGLYRRVTELCHRRIWKDNLDDLWEGEVEKLPPLEAIEAKLFRENVEVLHARKGGQFNGGAILETFQLKVVQDKGHTGWLGVNGYAAWQKQQAEESKLKEATAPGAKLKGKIGKVKDRKGDDSRPKDNSWDVRTAFAPIGYVHCFATEPKSRVGKALWEEICRLALAKNVLLVACHSVLRQGTVDFWRSQGMKRVDLEDAQERALFKSQINVRSQGCLTIEVEDLTQALPKSALPLFAWVNPAALEAWNVSAEKSESEVEDEARTSFDRKLKRELLKMRSHLRSR